MSGTDPAHRATAALTDRELEVLRLLTAGHTIKSIAAVLGRSEASINERLRDARRKTGVGSSRELARLVAGQENWPRKTDLSPAGDLGDVDEQPASAARYWPKGKIAMLALLPLAAGVMLVSSVTHQTETPTVSHPPSVLTSPLAGTWSLDTARIPADERPRSVTIAFRVSPDQQWSTRVDIVAPDGSTMTASSTARPDGVAVPISGNIPIFDAVSLRQPASNTLVMTLGKGGAPVATRVYTVARDGKSMTETIVWADKTMPKMETTYFNRVG
ncbi:helix-turn-helix domain-containing protein [Novosphingobium jiangmenense]|uniref:Helix-turn-helix transcriptional regulator n=1 Tax=Novosphingobium jiangmenense TaxID=2791981 RepID=A0ABS0HH47_9SPHN|nr:helix-turn-helix transcriptional regulator [Novosphingobium jiangmenense]MBF9151284.1 helix-turn-helix transcriptional regulator [Novosphingobium jiangmenense]